MHREADPLALESLEPSAAAVDLHAAPRSQPSAEFLLELLETSATWLIALDLDGAIRFTSRALPTTTRDLMIDTPLTSWIARSHRREVAARIDSVQSTGQASTLEVALCDAPESPLHLVLTPRSEAGEVTGLVATLSVHERADDVEEEQRQIDDRVEQIRRAESLSVLAGGVAHDFNNLLVAMLGNASLLREQSDPKSLGHEMAVEIENAARRASDLCDRMLDYAGLSPLRPQEASLSDVCESILPKLRRELPPQVRLICDLPPQTSRIRCDPALVARVVSALVHNAIEALPTEGGTIRLRTGTGSPDTSELQLARIDRYLPGGEYAVLEVEDDGCGMDVETCERIFDPYFTTKFAGRGLSLAAVQGIVRSHSGGIRAHSEPGRGTAVQVFFPIESRLLRITQELPALPAGTTGSESGRSGVSPADILLALPERSLAQQTADLLQGPGRVVVQADDGGAALREFSRDPSRFAAVCIDLSLPEVHGHELLTAVRSRSRTLPVVVCSHLAADDLHRLLGGDERVYLVRKPAEASDVAALLLRLLDD